MKVPLLICVLSLCSAEAAMMLGNTVKLTTSSFCKLYHCVQTSKVTEKSEYGQHVVTKYQVSGLDMTLESMHTTDGALLSADINIPRFPLSVEDTQLAVKFVKSLVGNTYTPAQFEKCFSAANSFYMQDALSDMGEEVLVYGTYWGAKCQVVRYVNSKTSRIYIFIAD